MSCQRVAFAHLLASTVWTACTSFACTTFRHHLVQVQLSLGAIAADPMHQLFAAKSSSLGINAAFRVALSVPLQQQWVLRCLKCWLCKPISSRVTSTALRTTGIIQHTRCNLSLPLMAACGALPLSPVITASKRLLRCLGILVTIPVLCLPRCLSSKRVVLTHCFPLTIWAFGASCAATDSCLPDMRASCWTVRA